LGCGTDLALDYHYWSQPLPTIFGWRADQHPEWFKHFSRILPRGKSSRHFYLPALGSLPLDHHFSSSGNRAIGNYCFFNLSRLRFLFAVDR
jgi:hypothetical protein